MDIITYGKVVKISNEIKEAREDNVTLDARLEKIALGRITTVKEKEDLPSPGVPGAFYGVTVDESNQNLPTLYIYSDGYKRIVGSNVSYNFNGVLTIDGVNVTVYEHPAFHSADILMDGEHNKAFTSQERLKLSRIEEKANFYEHPKTHVADMLVDGIGKKVFTSIERTKLENIENEANHYIHPDTHSADMIIDGADHVSMTVSERKRLSVVDPWDAISDLVDYTDVVTYFAFDMQGRVIRQVVTDNYTEQIVTEPLLTMPISTDGYAQNDSFLVISVGEVHRLDGQEFVQLPTLVDVIYQYDDEGRLDSKSITRMAATPIQTNFKYIYDSLGNRIAVKKY